MSLVVASHIPKHAFPVRVMFVNGVIEQGVVFIRPDQRVLDLMCDERGFFPFQRNSGLTFVNKASIIHIEEVLFEGLARNDQRFPGIDLEFLNATWPQLS